MTPERKAREQITRMIEAAGWSYREEAAAARRGRTGFADYLLFDEAGTAIAVLEAKSAEKDPLVGKEQAREYGVSLGVSHVILSNGELHYVWDTRAGDPKRVLALPAPAELINLQSRPPRDRPRLWTTDVKPDYLKTVAESDIEMRPYQVAAINAVQRQAQAGDTAFLLEMEPEPAKPPLPPPCASCT